MSRESSKTLVVYFSLEGNTRLVANELKKRIGADLLELRPAKAYPTGGFTKFLWGGKSVLMKETPELEPFYLDLSPYDTVVLGTPIWASSIAPPLRTFLQDAARSLASKRVVAFACCAGGDPGKAIEQIQELANTKVRATAVFVDPKKGRDENWNAKLGVLAGAIQARPR